MIYFHSDYGQGAHPKVLQALTETNLEYTDGYGLDPYCERAKEIIRELVGDKNCDVHFMIGGTPCNVTVIAASLKPYETVIALRSGHAYIHETGGVEATGHRIVTVDGINGKMTPELVDKAMEEFSDEHTPKPRMVYISQPTETGTLYSKAEMWALSEKCRERGLLFYVDGARLGSALTAKKSDLDIRTIHKFCDAFYIGGTKNGALLGEALVIKNKAMGENFRFMIKRQCGLLAKGRILGVQFEALLKGGEDSLYYEIAAHANRAADRIREGLKALGVEFLGDSPTNQIFPVLPVKTVEELRKDFFFYDWAKESDGMLPVRIVTSWGTTDEDVDAFLKKATELLSAKR